MKYIKISENKQCYKILCQCFNRIYYTEYKLSAPSTKVYSNRSKTLAYNSIARISVFRKKSKLKTITTFEKSLFKIEYQMRYAIYMPPNTKDLAINQTMVAYENWQNVTAFAQANNFDLLRSLKHLMETRLN